MGKQKIRGFNFDSVEDILNYLKTYKGKGQFTIYAENSIGQKTRLWKGIVFPHSLVNSRGGKK